MTDPTKTPRRRGRATTKSLNNEHAASAHRSCQASFLAGSPLNCLVSLVPRHARRGVASCVVEPIGAFRTNATKLITRHLAERGFPALWVASVERSEGWGAHLHVAIHLPPSLHPAELQTALVSRFGYDREAIDRENARRIALGHTDLIFEPVDVALAQNPDDGWQLIDYVTKGAHEDQGRFACTPLTISHALTELVRQHEPQLTHITPGVMHRHFGRDQIRLQRRAKAEQARNLLRRLMPTP